MHFGSLLFGYAFLWTVDPNWPPPSYLQLEMGAVALALAGAAALPAGPRLAAHAIARSTATWPGIVLAIGGALSLSAAAASILLARPNPSGHAYDATLWRLAGDVGLHTALTMIMVFYLAARIRAGYASPNRSAQFGERGPVLERNNKKITALPKAEGT